MKKRQRILSFLMMLTMLASFMTVTPVTVSANTTSEISFTDDFNSAAEFAENWTVCYTANADGKDYWSVDEENGRLTATKAFYNALRNLKFYTGESTWSDYVVETKIGFTSDLTQNTDNFGVLVRASNMDAAGKKYDGYYVAINTTKAAYTDGTTTGLYNQYPLRIDVYKSVSGAESLVATMYADDKHPVQYGWYVLKVAAYGNTFRVYIDDEYIGSYTDEDPIETGYVGINQYRAAIRADYFTVRSLTNAEIDEFFAKPAPVDFIDNFDGDALSDDWTVYYTPDSNGNDYWGVSDGKLYGAKSNSTALKNLRFFTGDASWTDYAVETKFRITTTMGWDTYDAGVVVRASDLVENGKKFDGYYISIEAYKRDYVAEDGTTGAYATVPMKIRVNKIVDGAGGSNYYGYDNYPPLATFDVEGKYLAQNTDYKLKVLVYGDTMRVYLDDEFVGEVVDGTYESGIVGINQIRTGFAADYFSARDLTEDDLAEFGVEPEEPDTPEEPSEPEEPEVPEVIPSENPPIVTRFIDNFNGSELSSKWKLLHVPTDEGEKVIVSNGRLELYAPSWNTFKKLKLYTGDSSWMDYSVEASFLVYATDPRTVGLLVRADNLGTSSTDYTGYYVVIDVDKRNYANDTGNGLYSQYPMNILVYRCDGSNETLIDKFTVEDTYFAKNSVYYKLKVLVFGNRMRIYLDDKFVGQCWDDTYTNGYVGINQYMSACYIDDFAVRALTLAEKDEFGIVHGDADGDGATDMADLLYFGRAIAMWKGYTLPEYETVLDINRDGNVNPLDLVYLARYFAGWDDIWGDYGVKEDTEEVVWSEHSDPVTISFKSAELLEANSVLADDGEYEFTGDALKLAYSESDGQYGVAFKAETAGLLAKEHTLAQVTYLTDATSGELRLYTGDEYVVLESDVSKSAGKWTTASLATLDEDMIASINKLDTAAVRLYTTESDANVQLKQLMLYTSSEQADAASSDADPIIYKATSKTNDVYLYETFGGKKICKTEYASWSMDTGVVYNVKLLYNEDEMGNYRMVFGPADPDSADCFLTSDTWYIRVRYKTNADEYSRMSFINNQNGDSITLESNFKNGNNEWKVSAPVQLPDAMVTRLREQKHVTVAFGFNDPDLSVYVSEVAFFPTLEEACDNYGDISAAEANRLSTNKVAMAMGDTETVKVLESDAASSTAGNWERNPNTDSVVLKYTTYDRNNLGNYRFMTAFNSVSKLVKAAQYVRVVYKATNPADQTEPVKLMLIANGKTGAVTVEDDVQDTNGEWVLSPVQQLYSAARKNFTSGAECTVSFTADQPGGEYEVSKIMFFGTLEEAEAYELETISINGTSIEEYVIVMPENARPRTQRVVNALRKQILETTGMGLRVITDAEPEQEHEIVVGNTKRDVSLPYYGENGKYVTEELTRDKYHVFVSDGDLVFTAGTEYTLEGGSTEFIGSFLTYGMHNIGTVIDLENNLTYSGGLLLGEYPGSFDDPAPVSNPDVFTDNFEDAEYTDGYWVEDYASDNWQAVGGVFKTNATDLTTARLHVFERDIDYTAKIRFDTLSDESNAGLTARYNDEYAFVRAGYADGQWYVSFSEGPEFNEYTLDTAAANVTTGKWYTLRITLNKNVVKFYVDGVLTLESEYVRHISPGPMGVFAENAKVRFDDVSVTLVSGQGKVLYGVVDSSLFWPLENDELASGSVHEMNDGTLWYIHHNEAKQFVSTDGGVTWTNGYFTDISTDCANMFRLASGKLIKILDDTIDGVKHHVSYTSSDEGKTWVRGGIISSHQYNGNTATNQTMENDKITQVSSGRVFVTQDYHGTTEDYGVDTIVAVFYSDDEGGTWTKSNTESTECTDLSYIAESKVIETEDGALLWITSHNESGYIVASESTDGGKTWGKFYNLTDFTCARSSFGIMRDVYADNETTYYMVWVYNEPSDIVMPRTRLGMAMTTDGRNWQYIGDAFRWENTLMDGTSATSALITHICDPFITVTEDYIFVGSGLSRRMPYDSYNGYHNRQHQKLIRIEKDTLTPYEAFPQY